MRPYAPSGRFDSPALIRTLLFAGVAAVGAGCALGFVGGFFRLLLIWPGLLGLAAGAAAARGVTMGKVRAPVMAALVGLAAALLGIAAEQGWMYHRTRADLRERLARSRLAAEQVEPQLDLVFAAQVGASTAEEAEAALERLAAAPAPPAPLTVWRGWLELRWRTSSISKSGQKGVELGRTGGMILWSIEALIVLGIGLAMTRGAAREPFCEECETWLGPARQVALIQQSFAPDLARALEAGDDEALAKLVNAQASGPPCVQLTLRRCECAAAAPYVEAQKVELDSNGKATTKSLAAGFSDSKVLGGVLL